LKFDKILEEERGEGEEGEERREVFLRDFGRGRDRL